MQKGVTPDEVGADPVDAIKEPTRSARGILAKYGPAPSAEEIDENRDDF